MFIPFSVISLMWQSTSLLPVPFPFYEFETLLLHPPCFKCLERGRGMGWGCDSLSTQILLTLALLKLYSVGAKSPSPVGNMGKPEYCMGHSKVKGSPAVQAGENPPLPIPGRNGVGDMYLLPRAWGSHSSIAKQHARCLDGKLLLKTEYRGGGGTGRHLKSQRETVSETLAQAGQRHLDSVWGGLKCS